MSNISLKGRSFLKLLDFTADEIRYLLDLSKELKEKKQNNIPHDDLRGRNIVLLFEKTSTRTRCAFEVAAYDLGMGVSYLDSSSSQMGHKESIEDTAKVLGRMFDGIEYRGFSQSIVEELSKYSAVPVWNGLTTEFHPTQMLADVLTIEENFGSCKGLKLVYMGDARNNVANSLMVVSAKLGMNYVACCPNNYMPNQNLIDVCLKIASDSSSHIDFICDVREATNNADVIYTDVWLSMGEDKSLWDDRIKQLLPYQVNRTVMSYAKDDAIFLHCLPSFHNLNTKVAKEIYDKYGLKEMEVTDEVFSSKKSKVFDEAENRLHTIKAVMLATLK